MTRYAIRSRKTGRTYYRRWPDLTFHDWCMEGEGELKFNSATEATLYAFEQGVTDFEIVPVY